MAKRFIVFNNKIIKFGSTGIIFDSENSGGGVVADPFRSATVTAVVENGYVNPTITGDTNNDLDHWAVYVAGQSGNKYTFRNSVNVNSIIDYFGLTAPDNSVKTYSMRIQGVTANGTTTSTSSFSIAVTGAVVEIPDADPITILTFGWSNGSGTNPLMSFTPSNSSALTYEIMSSKTGTSNTFSLGASTSFNALEALEALGYTINPGASTTVRFKVRGINTNGTSSWSSYSDTVTVARANVITPEVDSWENYNVTLYNEANFLGFNPDHGTSNGRLMSAIVTPSETTTFRTITVFSNISHLDTVVSGASGVYGPRIYKLSSLPGTADGAKDQGDLTGLLDYSVLVNSEMEILCAAEENGELNWTTDFGGKYGKPVTINGQQMYAYEARLSNGNNITLTANNIYLIGLNPNTGGTGRSNEETPADQVNYPLYIPMLSDYTVAEGSNGACGYVNTNNSSTIPTRCGYYNTTQNGGNASIARGLPMFCVNGYVFTNFKGFNVEEPIITPETDPMEGASITATANTTTVSWTNLSSVSTFANYEYYVETISVNIKTTTSNSVTIETLKTQFSLADDTTYQLKVKAKSTNGNYSNLATVTFTTPAATSGGGSTDTPTSTVNRLERTFTSTADTAYAKDDGSGWYSFAYNASYGLAVAMHEPNDKSTPAGWPDNPPAAIITLSNTEVFDGTNGVHLAADVNCIAKEEIVAGITCDNGYSCLRLCFRDSSGNTSNWVDLHLNEGAIVEGTSNGVGAGSGHNSMTIDLDLSSICNKSGFNKSAINAIEVHLAQWSTGTSFKERQKGLYFNNIVLTNS